MRTGLAAGILAFVVAGGIATNAKAVVLASDDFSYANGATLEGQNGGVGFAAPWFVPANGAANKRLFLQGGVVNFDVTGPQGGGGVNRQNAMRALPFAFTPGSTAWMSFDLQSQTANTLACFDGISLLDGTASNQERLFLGHSTYISHNANWRMVQQLGNIYQPGAETPVPTTGVMKTGVVEFVIGAGASSTAYMWVGQDNISAVDVGRNADATAVELTLDSTAFVAVAGDGAFALDNLRFGTEAADVGAVPEPATVGMLSVGAMVMLRRRRKWC